MIETIKYSILILPLIGIIMGTISITNEAVRYNVIINSGRLQLILILFSLLIVNWDYIELNGHIGSNNMIKIMELLLIIVSLSYLEIVKKGVKNKNSIKVTEESIILILTSIIGMLISMEAGNLITLFLSIEITSICFYILVLNKNSKKISIEGALKYYIMGGIASTLILLGAVFLYAESGSLMYADIFAYYARNSEISLLGEIGIILIICSLFIKLGMAPFHGWLIDTYEGTGLITTFFLTLTQKIVIMTILINLYINVISQISTEWLVKFIMCALYATFVIGIFGGLRQQNLVRFIAYSGIVNSGLLTMFMIGHAKEEIVSYSIFYLINYIIGLFGVVLIIHGIKSTLRGTTIQILGELKKLWVNNRIIAISLMLLLAFLAGLPPFTSFVAKIVLMMPFLQLEQVLFFIFIVFAPVGIMVYYIQIIRYIIIEDQHKNVVSIAYTSIGSLSIGVCLIWMIFAQLYIDELVGIIKLLISTSM